MNVLIVLDGRPQIVENSEKEMSINYAEQITMFCTSVGSPLPTITWKKSRRKIGIRIKRQFFSMSRICDKKRSM